jgi:hypothetical protein
MKYRGDYGYTDLVLNNRYEVSYVGPGNMTPTEAKKFALYRMCDLASGNRVEFIKIIDEKYDRNVSAIRGESERSESVSGDSAGIKRVVTRTGSSKDSAVVKPIVTLVGVGSDKSDSSSIEVLQILHKAESEDGIQFAPAK